LILGGIEVGRKGIAELLLERSEVCRRAISSCLVPEGNEMFIEWSEKGDEMYEAMEMM
jgi:hypothetical protein